MVACDWPGFEPAEAGASAYGCSKNICQIHRRSGRTLGHCNERGLSGANILQFSEQGAFADAKFICEAIAVAPES